MRRLLALLLLALTAGLALPAAAAADAFDDVFAAYRSAGRIEPCKFSAETLQSARSQIPNDIEQYAPDFPAALDAALSARARGACDPQPTTPATTAPDEGGGAVATTPAPGVPAGRRPGGSTPQPTPQAVPAAAVGDGAIPAAAAATRGDDGAPAPAALVLLAVLGALLLLGLAGWGAARWWAWEPLWLERLRHALGEAGWRTGAAWSEFTDWVRLGR
jgi:hypothetical protein